MKKLIYILCFFCFSINAQNIINSYAYSNPNEGEIYRNEFTDLTGLTIANPTGTVTIEAPIGTVVLPQNALTVDWVTNGKNYASVDLGQTYEELYIQYYVSIIKSSDASGYKDNFQVSAQTNGGNEVAEIKINHSATYHRIYGLPSYQNFTKRFANGEVTKVGIHINKTTLTADYYFNGDFVGQKPANDKTMQFITLGGTGVAGYKVQYSSLTVNTFQFSQGVSNVNGIGEDMRIYIDYEMDSGIDASAFTGMHKEPFDPDGGTNYIDGALRYSSDANTNYFQPDGKVFFNKGSTFKLKDLTDTHKLNFSTGYTTITDNYLVDSYGTGDNPKIDTSIILDTSIWTLDDAPNNVYRGAVANIGNLTTLWVDETLGLRESTNLSDFSTFDGIFYVDGSDVLVKLYDGSNPATHQIDAASNTGFNINDFCTLQNLHFRFGGTSVSGNVTFQLNEYTQGSSATVSNALFQYNNLHDIWNGARYDQQTLSGGVNGITANDNAVIIYNTVQDSYIGIQIPYGSVNPLVAFNVVKNVIVNHIQCSGGSGSHADASESIKIINNTIFASPRHATNDPYPMTASSVGHGIVMQSGASNNYVEIINNLSMLHYNHTNLPFTGGANCVAVSGASQTILTTIDYNKYYKSPNSDTWAKYFTSGTNNDFALHKSQLLGFGAVGIGGNPELNTTVVTVLPVLQVDQTTTSGKWLTTNPTPTITGDGYAYDFSAWNITKDLSGNTLTASRNIGAH